MKKLLASLLGILLVLSLAMTTATFVLAEEGEDGATNVIDNPEWTKRASLGVSTYEIDTGYHVISEVAGEGHSMTSNFKVKVDGLTLEFYSDSYNATSAGDYFGIAFVKTMGGYASTYADGSKTFAACFRPKEANRGRLSFRNDMRGTANNGGFIAYKTAELAANSITVTDGVYSYDTANLVTTFWSSFVFGDGANDNFFHVKLEFSKVEGLDAYKMVVSSESCVHAQQANPQTMYIHSSYVDNAADENGNVYLSVFGGKGSSSEAAPVVKVRYSDDATRAYESTIASADTLVTKYENILKSGSVSAALKARAELAATIAELKPLYKAVYEAKISALEEKYGLNELTVINDNEWKSRPANNASSYAKYDIKDGSYLFDNINAYGYAMNQENKVKVDGLTVELYSDNYTISESGNHDCFGFTFVNEVTGFNDDQTFAATFWPGIYNGQTRLNIGRNHNYNITIAYAEPVKGSTPAGAFTSSMVYTAAAGSKSPIGARLHFTHLADKGVYQLDFTMTYGTKFQAQKTELTVYFDEEYVTNIVDDNGYAYLSAFGFTTWKDEEGELDGPVFKIKYSDALTDAYKTGVYTAAEAALVAYENSVAEVTDTDTFNASVQARTAAIDAVNALRANDVAIKTAEISRIDALYTQDEDIQANVKAVVQAAYTEAETALAAFNAEVTADNLSAYKAKVAAANEVYEGIKTALTAENKAYFEGLSEDLAYNEKKATVVLWIVGYENLVAVLDADSDTLIEDIDAAKTCKVNFAGSATETLLNGLADEDKETLSARITAADTALETVEKEVLPAVKASYVTALENALDEDLTVKFNIDDAKAAYADLLSKITVTEADGELYTRYTAAYTALKTACEDYELGLINTVNTMLEETYKDYNAFTPVLVKYGSINLGYLMEDSDDLQDAYDEMYAALNETVWFKIGVTDISNVEQTATGLYFEQVPAFPSRLNYNEKVNLKKGVTVEIELTEAAYYNDGTSANNLCFNFLGSPNSYKSMSDGISIIIWLFPTESNVEIFNNNDNALARKSIDTPIDGGKIIISVRYGEYYSVAEGETKTAYIINVNGVEFQLTEEVLTRDGYQVYDDCYFSMGSFADDKTKHNCMTLVSVNDVKFAYEEPVKPVDSASDPESVSAGNSEDISVKETSSESRGCKGGIATPAAIAAVAGVAYALIRRKREN
ncbi:MAG: hypothetical protein IJU84_05265 [Clostridia bacterium]|nr:hypothetical protein [Clostridia bacterium]